MIGPNLSAVAVSRRSVTIYLMIVAVVAGSLAFFRLGRNEDPAFTFRTMVVQAAWPGASIEETLLQVTERLERTLQEVPNLDTLRSYTVPGQTTIFVDLKGATPPSVVPDMWYQVRKRVGDMRHTLPQGVIGPGFDDDFGDTFGIIYGFTADGFTHRELRDQVEEVRSRLLRRGGRGQGGDDRRAGRAHLPRILDRAARRPRARPAGAGRGAAGAKPGAAGRPGRRPATSGCRSASPAPSRRSRTCWR